ncbi:MAG TPA: Na+/H+ antiporter [Candidatus Limnocylindrales bacterium]
MIEIRLVLGLLVAATALAYIARRIGIAYPIALTLGGLALGLVPNLPRVELPPELVFLLFLPPVLFAAGYTTPARDFKANLQPIAFLAVGLVLFTTVCVALVAAWLVPEMELPAAFALGAIVAPPDAVAATAIFRRLGVPRKVVTILEGESLVNDATALTAYRFAVLAAVSGTFSLGQAAISFVVISVGGIAIGVVVGWLLTEAWRRTQDPTLEIIISLLAPIAAYLPAEQLGVSGVLATVTAGLMAGRAGARVLSSEARLLGRGVWNVVIFLVNGLAFILIGLQLPAILGEQSGRSGVELLGLGAAISLVVIVTRLAWVIVTGRLRLVMARRRVGTGALEVHPSTRTPLVAGWAGMRGVVSLAAALSLPLTLGNGEPFPERNLILFLTFVVILVTLVGQGLSLPMLIRRLRLVEDGGAEREETRARQAAGEAALNVLAELELRWPGHRELVDQLRSQYEHRASHVETNGHGPADEQETELYEHRQIRRAVIDAEREAVILLRDDGVISDAVLRVIERDLDLEELRMEA